MYAASHTPPILDLTILTYTHGLSHSSVYTVFFLAPLPPFESTLLDFFEHVERLQLQIHRPLNRKTRSASVSFVSRKSAYAPRPASRRVRASEEKERVTA